MPGGTISYIADPVPYPGGGYGGGYGGGWGPYRPHWPWPGPIVDKAAYPGSYRPVQIVDPGPDPWGGVGGGLAGNPQAATFARIGHVGDPPPPDVSRFSIAQLEASLHSINAEKARLASMETMIKQQLEKLKHS
jgi:hypothetical protein